MADKLNETMVEPVSGVSYRSCFSFTWGRRPSRLASGLLMAHKKCPSGKDRHLTE